MQEHKGIITVKGTPLTLLGNEVKAGDKAPNFTVLDNELNPVTLDNYKQKVLIISAVPSLDTPVCAIETVKFNREAAKLGNDVKILTISMDLPFAQKRYCAAEGIDVVQTLSDHREASFGLAYGVLTKESRLLARVIFVLDENRIVRYKQVVHDISNEPNYSEVLNTVHTLLPIAAK
jgi:thioredoxin-dependent peroxiredoxin